ncbi:MAG: acylglycerol kinase family protein, partial [Blastocatellia bacterium]
MFIINPASGRRTGSDLWRNLRARIASSNIQFEEKIADQRGSAERLTREALVSGAARVVAVGGDGTLNEVVNGYLDESGKPVNPEAELG